MNSSQLHTLPFEALLNSIDHGIIQINSLGSISYKNAAFCKTFGEELCNMEHLVQLSNGSFPDVTKIHSLQQAVHSVITKEVFFPVLKLWFLIKIHIKEGGFIVEFSDITLHKEAKDLFIDEETVSTLINIVDQPIWFVDIDCKLKLFNASFTKWIKVFTGYQLAKGDNVIGAQLNQSYLNKFTACYQKALSGQVVTAVEDMNIDGAIRFTTISFMPTHDTDGQVNGISCHATDITEQRNSLIKIDEQTKLLLEIANIQSHKVRGPLSTLIGLVQLFNFENVTDPENAEIVKGIADVSYRLDDVVKDVVRYINKINTSGHSW